MHGSPLPEELALIVWLWLLVWLVGVVGGVVCLFIGVFRPGAPMPRIRRALAVTNLITGGVTLAFCITMGLFDPGLIALCAASIIVGGLLGFSGAGPTLPTIVDAPRDREAAPISLPRGTGRRQQPRRSGGRPGKQAGGAR